MRHDRPRLLRSTPTLFRLALAVAALAIVGTAPAQAGITSPYVRKKIMTLAPGITWERGTARTTNGVQSIQVGRIDMSSPSVSLESLLSNDKVIRLERPSLNADRNSRPGSLAIIATNGDVSTAGDSGAGAHPPSMHVHAGEVMVGTSCGRPTLGIDADGTARMGSVRIRGELDMTSVVPGYKGTVPIRGINRQGGANQMLLFTNRWGPTTLTRSLGTDVVLVPSGTVRPTGRFTVTVESVTLGVKNSAIPAGRMVLSGIGDKATILARLAPGNRVEIVTAMHKADGSSCTPSDAAPEWDDVVEVMGGNYYTALNGRNAAPSYSAYPKGGVAAPRTNVGITADGDVLMVVVDGRQTYSVGMTLSEMGDLMLQLGAVTAFNLDGGGSSVMATRLVGAEHITVSNSPSDGTERALTQALAVFSSAAP